MEMNVFHEASLDSLSAHYGLLHLLIDKGVITYEEYQKSKMDAREWVINEWDETRQKVLNETTSV